MLPELCQTVKKIINYSQIDKKSLAIVFAVKHFQFFPYGYEPFVIHTDHKPLTSMLGVLAK